MTPSPVRPSVVMRMLERIEPFDDRLRRFLSHEDEVPLTLLVWAQNYLLPQVRMASDNSFENLVFLITHAFIQAFSEKVLGRRGPTATSYFLESFMDEVESDRQFSRVSDEIHEMRNVMAHQLFSSRTHDIAFDYGMAEGWRRDQNLLRLNPNVYAEQFIAAVDGGRAWSWKDFIKVEDRVKLKYQFVRDWLDLPKTDAIRQAVDRLAALTTPQDIEAAGAAIAAQITHRYGL